MKKCSHCKKLKQKSGFYKNRTKSGGLSNHCKECGNKWHKALSKAAIRTTKYRFSHSIREAKRRGLIWTITFEQFEQLCNEECNYCGGLLGKVEAGIGLDRMDNAIGYTLENVLPCCEVCNKTRNKNFTVHETWIMINALLKYRSTNGTQQK